MNFCAALYTLSFLYIFVWLRLHCKKQRSEPSTPVSQSVPLPVFLCFLSAAFIYFLPLSSLLLFFYVSRCPFLRVSYSPHTFIPFILSLVSHLSFNYFWVVVPGVHEESHAVSAKATTRVFTVYKEVIWIFAATNFLVELVWIWSQNESYHFDVMERGGGMALHINWALLHTETVDSYIYFLHTTPASYARGTHFESRSRD